MPQHYANEIYLIEADTDMAFTVDNELEVVLDYKMAMSLSNENRFPKEEALA